MLHENRNKLIHVGLVISFSLIACSLFTGSGETPPPSPSPPLSTPGYSDPLQTATPNLTLTAVFAPQLTFIAQTRVVELTGTSEALTTTPTPTATSTLLLPTLEPLPTLPPMVTTSPTLIPITTLTPIYLDFSAEETPTVDIRPGPSVNAVYKDTPPTIDGDIGDWQQPLYAVENVVSGLGYYANEKDLSAEVKLAWDMQFLYIGALVRDTKFAQRATGSQLWQGDSLEILLDTDLGGDFDHAQLSLDDYQLGISPGNLAENPIPEAYLWAPRQFAGGITSIQIASRLTDDGYMIETAIPWSVFFITPYQGQHFGFLFSVSDNDTIDKDTQQSVISFAPQRLLHDPTSWRDLVLGGP
jgi:beta-glucosidase